MARIPGTDMNTSPELDNQMERAQRAGDGLGGQRAQ